MQVKVRKKPVRKSERAEKNNRCSDVIILNQEMIDLASAKALSSVRQCRYPNP